MLTRLLPRVACLAAISVLSVSTMTRAEPYASIQITVDHTTYLNGEATTYQVSGAPPNTVVYWSSSFNGKSTGERDQAYYANPSDPKAGLYRTDANGNLTIQGGTWTPDGVHGHPAASFDGLWVKTARFGLDGPSASVAFNVTDNELSRRSRDLKSILSISNWDGVKEAVAGQNALEKGAQLVESLGVSNIHVDLSPQSVRSYPGLTFPEDDVAGASGCQAGTSNMGCLAKLADTSAYQHLFSKPFKTFLVDTYSFSTFDWVQQSKKKQYTADIAKKDHDEIYTLTKYLLQKYAGTGKTFVLKNWEGDYALGENQYDLSTIPNQFQIKNMISFLNARDSGMRDALRDFAYLKGVQVKDAVEFVDLKKPKANLPSMLRDVIPFVHSDMVSYSSYQTLDQYAAPALYRGVLDDIDFIRNYQTPEGISALNGRPLIIGEYGIPNTSAFPDGSTKVGIATKAFADAGIPLASYWQVQDNESHYGVFDRQDNLTATGEMIACTVRHSLAPEACYASSARSIELANPQPVSAASHPAEAVSPKETHPAEAISIARPDDYSERMRAGVEWSGGSSILQSIRNSPEEQRFQALLQSQQNGTHR